MDKMTSENEFILSTSCTCEERGTEHSSDRQHKASSTAAGVVGECSYVEMKGESGVVGFGSESVSE